nr:MAG TPA: hypothetical protein [Bacteriophage sp.]
MFKHCKHRDYFSIHKIFSRKFLPGAPFSQNPFLFSSSFFRFVSPFFFTSVNTFHISLYPPSPFFTSSSFLPQTPYCYIAVFLSSSSYSQNIKKNNGKFSKENFLLSVCNFFKTLISR